MFNNSRVLAIIPARGGSKSIPKKNIKPLAGKPLIAWSIETAKVTPEVDRIIVSTDDDEIASVAVSYGAEVYKRPAHLATDESLVIHAIQLLVKELQDEGEKAKYMVLLEPTSPLRLSTDVSNCIRILTGQCIDSVATFKDAELNPHRAWQIDNGQAKTFIPGAIPWYPRQKLPRAYQLNGAVYAFRADRMDKAEMSLFFGRTAAVMIPKERSVDIDDEIDWELAEILMKRRLQQCQA
ncbi:acylneuraminate cytidylyltransferase family protein [Desulfoscipio sp. XC116]|uniref:acylneuraminate cytidylyltransferase family protein n=1 Tax=Desulfoscipio sp. XC116 TaxID=3144975 RepID=UPI00325AB68F